MTEYTQNEFTVLVVGGGGREHALCWKLAQSKHIKTILCAPGNGGTAFTDKTKNVPIPVTDFPALIELAKNEKVDLTVIGPDNPLADGIVDAFENAGLRVFGPTKEQAKVEWSKAHAKKFLMEVGIPTARFEVCSNLGEGFQLIAKSPWAQVVKADGLALGKGVYVCNSSSEVALALTQMLGEKRFGKAGEVVVLEEKLIGEELSLIMLCDGKTILPLAASQDYKRRFDDDQGPNTGGMGAYSPVKLYDQFENEIENLILAPLRKALADGKLSFKGVLYAGILFSQREDGSVIPMVLEFNARFGDPETQAILPRLESDLLPALWACTNGSLDKITLVWKKEASCCVVAVTKDYPEKSAKDGLISVGELGKDSVLFHAGTKNEGSKVYTAGGRVLCLTSLAPTLEAASQLAYNEILKLSFDQIDYRRDIARERSKCH
jgi:phosphoribosylamine---glycine ligase